MRVRRQGDRDREAVEGGELSHMEQVSQRVQEARKKKKVTDTGEGMW